MIRLFHISDLHFGAEDRLALEWFERTVAADNPDAIIVTGDLTLRARPREFRAAAEWLRNLGRPITIEPGNHDLPYFDLWARFLAPYDRFRAVERAIEKPLELAGVAVVPLKSTARFQWRFDWSKGHVGRKSLQNALRLIAAVPRERRIFVATHHPLIEAGTRSSARTHGGEHALGVLARAGVRAVLTGHVHDPFDVTYEIDGLPIRLIGAGTLSERTRASAPSFNEIRVEDGGFKSIPRRMGLCG